MNLTRRILLGIVIFLLAAAAIALAFILFRYNMLPFMSKKNQPPKEYTYDMGDFTVNLDEPDYKRYIKVVVTFGAFDKKLGEELEEKQPQIRDSINKILRSKNVEDVCSAKGMDNVAKEMIDKVNSILSSGKIDNVYFPSILIQ